MEDLKISNVEGKAGRSIKVRTPYVLVGSDFSQQ